MIKELYTLKNESDLEILFKQHYTKLCNIAYRIINDKIGAEDIVQEVFIKVWETKDKINITTTIEGYLIKSVTNTSLNYLKKHKKVVFEDAVSKLSKVSSDIKTDQKINYEELHKIVYEALDKLPPKCRTIFVLSRFEEMKNKEIAEHLDISVKTVENQMSIAIDKLQNNLKESLKQDYITLGLIFAWLGIINNS